jgi:hypothetical protein
MALGLRQGVSGPTSDPAGPNARKKKQKPGEKEEEEEEEIATET